VPARIQPAAVGLALLLVVAGCGTSVPPSPSPGQSVAKAPSVMPTAATGTPEPSSPSPRPTAQATTPEASATPLALPQSSPPAAELPVREPAEYYADSVRMTPGSAGGLYVSIPTDRGSVVALLDSGGKPRPGWPIAPDAGCGPAVFAAKGSVRVVCTPGSDAVSRAYAFTPDGHLMAGWPVEFPGQIWATPRVVDGQLVVMAYGNPGAFWLVAVAPDGTIRTGTPYESPVPSRQDWRAQLGPDGTGYLMAFPHEPPNTATGDTEITAFDLNGARQGWLARVKGWSSDLVFGPWGRIYVSEGQEGKRPSRILVFGPDGRPLPIGSDSLPVAATSVYQGAGPLGGPPPPVVAEDGTSFFVSEDGGTTVYGLDPSGRVMAGWPYREPARLQWGYCGPGAAGCGVWRAAPAVDPGDVLYLLHPPRDKTVGGSVVAIGPDGRVRPGWPVVLRRPGSEFRSVVVAADGTTFALAVEPEGGGRYSATVLAIAPDGTVRYRTTIIEP
jgi:hypothetical protein